MGTGKSDPIRDFINQLEIDLPESDAASRAEPPDPEDEPTNGVRELLDRLRRSPRIGRAFGCLIIFAQPNADNPQNFDAWTTSVGLTSAERVMLAEWLKRRIVP